MNLTGASLTQTALVFLTVLPESVTLRNGSGPEFKADVRTAQYSAAAISVALGVGLAVIANDWRPFAAAVIASAAMVAASEYVANTPPISR